MIVCFRSSFASESFGDALASWSCYLNYRTFVGSLSLFGLCCFEIEVLILRIRIDGLLSDSCCKFCWFDLMVEGYCCPVRLAFVEVEVIDLYD